MKRIKLSAPIIKTRADAELELGRIRQMTIQRNLLLLAIEEDRRALESRFTIELEATAKEIELRSESLRVWSESNPEEFNGRKSLEMLHGVVGWRVGNPTLKTIPGKTWDQVLDAIKDVCPEYIRTSVELNKQAILADREVIGVDKLRLLGMRVVQAEPFFVEPKLEESENRVQVGA